MARDTRTIRIESILGGESPSTHYAGEDEFFNSVNIDPAQPVSDNFGRASGLLRPVNPIERSNELLNAAPMWIKRQPKGTTYYIYDVLGSVYTWDGSFAGLGDLNDGGSATGNGAYYYDNYMYFARDTTIARYGPQNGSASWTDDYWVGTLGKTALTNTTYPNDSWTTLKYPNHVLHRHSDGKLYIADMVGNQGTIHYIQTTKTTVEGDTDNGSTYNALQVGYGLLPMAMESYGNYLVIAFCEVGSDVGTLGTASRQMNAKLAFWDTTSQKVNTITWSEYPDQIITALKNLNGVLYIFSGSTQQLGCRVTKYIGGYSVDEVAYFDDLQIQPPFPGAVDGTSRRLVFGTNANSSISPSGSNANDVGVVMSLGLQKASLGEGLFKVMGATGSNSAITSLTFVGQQFGFDYPYIGWSKGVSGVGSNGFNIQGGNYSQSPTYWQSQLYKIGSHFKITEVRIPIASVIGANTTVIPRLIIDKDVYHATASNVNTLTTINNSNFSGQNVVVLRPDGVTGRYSVQLELEWTGTALCTIALPIILEYEIIDD